MKKLMMMGGVAVTMAMGTMAETTNTVKVTKFHQLYSYSGKATVEYTRSGGAIRKMAHYHILYNNVPSGLSLRYWHVITVC